MTARILLVEDEDDLRELLAQVLVSDGHEVHTAADGHAALDVIAGCELDLVLLDVALGAGPDGIEVCRRVRRADSDLYVMMLTARDGEADVVLALEAGADDYVAKPIGIAELRSRVRAVLRRLERLTAVVPAQASEIYRAGALEVDVSAHRVRVDGADVTLTQSEFAVLAELGRASGRVVSRAQLLQAIFGDDAYRDPHTIDFHVHHVREKLGAAGLPPVIATVRGAGYRLESP